MGFPLIGSCKGGQAEVQGEGFISRLDASRAEVRKQSIKCGSFRVVVGVQLAIGFQELGSVIAKAQLQRFQTVDSREHLRLSPFIQNIGGDHFAQLLAVLRYGLGFGRLLAAASGQPERQAASQQDGKRGKSAASILATRQGGHGSRGEAVMCIQMWTPRECWPSNLPALRTRSSRPAMSASMPKGAVAGPSYERPAAVFSHCPRPSM